MFLQSLTQSDTNPGPLVATRSQQSLHSSSSLEGEIKRAKVLFDYDVSALEGLMENGGRRERGRDRGRDPASEGREERSGRYVERELGAKKGGKEGNWSEERGELVRRELWGGGGGGGRGA